MKLHDEHMHLRPHGVSPLPRHRLSPLLEACAERGVIPGIREHAPLPERYRLGPDEDYLFCMRVDEVDAFLGELEGSGVPVGFEVDHIDGHEAETQAIVADLFARAAPAGYPSAGSPARCTSSPARSRTSTPRSTRAACPIFSAIISSR